MIAMSGNRVMAAAPGKPPPVRNAADLADLLERVGRERDREAFALLFDYYAPRLKAVAMREGADEALAEDLVQDVMLTVWRQAASFDRTKAGASAWVFTVMRNRRIDLLRRGKFVDYGLDELPERPSSNPGPDEEVGLALDAEALANCLARLPVEQREVLAKAYFEEKSHSEIAEELKLPLGTVKSRVRLALARLRVLLEGREP